MKRILENIKYLSSILLRPIFMRLKLPAMKSPYVSIMTRNFVILMESGQSNRILVKNVIVLHVEPLMNMQLNTPAIVKADVEIAAGK
jgi:hypothetical protein